MVIRITKNGISPNAYRILNTVKRPLVLLRAGAKAMQVELSAHLRKLQARGNKKGWPSQRFFAGGPDSVERRVGMGEITDKRAEVIIADPRFVHRIGGGTVRAKRKKNLAIPLTAEAYAASGKGSIKESMPGLKVIVFKRGVYLCREVEERTTNGARGRNKFGPIKRIRVLPLFKLVRQVTHQPHPADAPDPIRLAAVAESAMLTTAKTIFKVE